MLVYGQQDDPVRVIEFSATHPLSCYVIAKHTSEHYVHVYRDRVPSVALRMFNTHGLGQDFDNLHQHIVRIVVAQAVRVGRLPVRGPLERFRDLVHIFNTVEEWVRAGPENNAVGRVLTVGSGVRTSVGELTAMISTAVGGCPIETTGGTPGDQFGITASTDILRAPLDFVPSINVPDGVAGFVE